jgi:hypothetical protein
VVAQAPLRNGDILWLGTPGDEDVVMIQCRFPQARHELRTPYTAPVAEDAPDETVALGALPAIPTVDPEPAVPGEPQEPELPEEAAIAAAAEESPAGLAEPAGVEPPPIADAAAAAPAPPTEVFMMDDSFGVTPPEAEPAPPQAAVIIPAEAPKFEVDFSKTDLPHGFEEEIEPTVADVPTPVPPPPPVAYTAPPTEVVSAPPPPPRAEAPPPPPPRREPPPPPRAEARAAPPPPQRRAAPRPAAPKPAAPAAAEGERQGMPAAVKWGALAAGVVALALGSFGAVRLLRGRQATPTAAASTPPPRTSPATQPTPPPTTVAMAPTPEPSPAVVAVDEVVTTVSAPPPPPPTTAAAAPAQSQRPPATPAATPSARATPTPTPRPSARVAAASPPPPSAPPVMEAAPAASRIASLLGQAETAAQGRSFDKAIRDFDEVLKLDPQNGRAVQGKADAQAAAASLRRSFTPGRTSISGKAAKADGLGGFETEGVTVTKVADYSGRIEFEVSPPHVLPGDSYTVRIFLVNDGKKAFKLNTVSVNTTTNGSRAGGPVPVRSRELEPRERLALDERTAEWPAGVTSWMLETVVQTDRDATFTSRLNWR